MRSRFRRPFAVEGGDGKPNLPAATRKINDSGKLLLCPMPGDVRRTMGSCWRAPCTGHLDIFFAFSKTPSEVFCWSQANTTFSPLLLRKNQHGKRHYAACKCPTYLTSNYKNSPSKRKTAIHYALFALPPSDLLWWAQSKEVLNNTCRRSSDRGIQTGTCEISRISYIARRWRHDNFYAEKSNGFDSWRTQGASKVATLHLMFCFRGTQRQHVYSRTTWRGSILLFTAQSSLQITFNLSSQNVWNKHITSICEYNPWRFTFPSFSPVFRRTWVSFQKSWNGFQCRKLDFWEWKMNFRKENWIFEQSLKRNRLRQRMWFVFQKVWNVFQNCISEDLKCISKQLQNVDFLHVFWNIRSR